MMKIQPASRAHVITWLPHAFTITVLIGLIYVGLQYHIRTAANDPQISLAESAAAQLFNNEPVTSVLAGQKVDIERSVSPFIILYDSNGRAADGTGRLDGQLPTLPEGVYDYTRQKGEDRVTWQPKSNTRIAAVVRYYQNDQHAGYVVAGKNLREVERETSSLLIFSAVAWLMAMVSSLVLTGLRHHPLKALRKAAK